jgi:hypothetical protein
VNLKATTIGKRRMPKKEPLTERRAARKKAEKVEKTAKLGSGKRFEAIEKAAKASGAKDPSAVAAAAGRKKYGTKKMTGLSKVGRKKS